MENRLRMLYYMNIQPLRMTVSSPNAVPQVISDVAAS
jgi:hypothetical protein